MRITGAAQQHQKALIASNRGGPPVTETERAMRDMLIAIVGNLAWFSVVFSAGFFFGTVWTGYFKR